MFYTDDNVFKKGLLTVKTKPSQRYIFKHLHIYSENGMIEDGFLLTNGEKSRLTDQWLIFQLPHKRQNS